MKKAVYLKNPKGRIVQVSKEAAEYLLNDKPTKTITGLAMTDDKNRPVVIKKAEHEKGYTVPTEAELKVFLKGTATKDADLAEKQAQEETKKAQKEAEKAAEAQAKADAKQAEANAKAQKAKGTAMPTPDN